MKRQILVVDDDSSVRESLRNLLEESGYAVVLASDGLAGAGRLQEGGFDLVVLDLNLPLLNGWDLLDLAQELQPTLPVIILTGLADQCEPGALGGATLMEKPPDVGLLIRTIERLLAEGVEKRLARFDAGSRQLLSSRPPGGSYLRLPKWPEPWPGQVQPGQQL